MALALCLIPSMAVARIYPTEILIDDEDDLRSLYEDGILPEDDYKALLSLLANPVDLNRAERDDLYQLPGITLEQAAAIVGDRVENGIFNRVEDLTRVAALPEGALAQIAPFAYARPPLTRTDPVRVRARFRLAKSFFEAPTGDPQDSPQSTHTITELGYGQGPRILLGGEIHAYKWLDAGAAFIIQESVKDVIYSAETRDFHVSWGTPMFDFGKAYISATREEGSAIVGSYTAGYGLGLTFDNTDQEVPHGWYADLQVNDNVSTSGPGHYSPTKRLFGGAARLTALRLGRYSFDFSAFGSSWTYDLYQYYMGMAGGEEVDPNTAELSSPRIYIDGVKVGWLTLPNAYRESLVGGNATFRAGRRSHVGITAWLGHLDRNILEGVEDPYDFVIRRGFPSVDTYGAVGVDAAFGVGLLDLRGEVSHTFTGGNALLVEARVTPTWGEFEVAGRRYDTGFDNPHAAGTAAADVYEGMRDRDEQGVRFRVKALPVPFLNVAATMDLWQGVSTGIFNGEAYLRIEARPHKKLMLAGFVDFKNRDLANNGRSRIYGSDDTDTSDTGASPGDEYGTLPDTYLDSNQTYGAGEKNYFGFQAQTTALPRTTLSFFYKRYYEDTGLLYPTGTGPCEPWFQVGHYLWGKVQVKLARSSQISFRIRYRDDDVWGDAEERSLEAWLQGDHLFAGKVKVSLRGLFGRLLPDPQSTWEEPCRTAGIPELEGTCAVEDSGTEEETILLTSRNYGELRLQVEVRF